jgi:hypothetical protein
VDRGGADDARAGPGSVGRAGLSLRGQVHGAGESMTQGQGRTQERVLGMSEGRGR